MDSLWKAHLMELLLVGTQPCIVCDRYVPVAALFREKETVGSLSFSFL